MRIIILGSGVIGVTSAYYLNKSGHEVTVVDRQPGAALETSFANAGQVSWSYASPWAAPGVPLNAIKWMFQPRSPLVLRPRPDLAMWSWLFRMLRNCTDARYRTNKDRMLRLARYSHGCLQALRHDTGLRYDERTRGMLQLFRGQKDLDAAARDTVVLDRAGIPYKMLDAAGCAEAEPGLRFARVRIAGGIRYPGDETGDCHKFTRSVADLAERAGVSFLTSTRIVRLIPAGDRLERVATDRGDLTADAYVVTAGSYSPLLVRPLGIRLPVYPVKGYSATIPIRDPDRAPVSTLTDERYKIAVTRLGDRIRAAGTAELAGYDLELPQSRCRTIRSVVEELFPQAGNLENAQYWTGLRPMTPDNVSVIGATPYRNLYLNTGHGTLGWTMSCGSACVLTDIMSGREPAIDMDGLTLARFQRT